MTALRSLIHVVASLHPGAGGPSRTVIQLTDALAELKEFDVSLVSQRLAGDLSIPSNAKVNRYVIESNYRAVLRTGLPAKKVLMKLARNPPSTVIHSHGLWTPINHWAAVAARRRGLPLIIQPRGMLEPWALTQKAAKKKIAMVLFQRNDIETSKLLVATSTKEYEGIRAVGFKNPIAIIPNGILMNEISARPFEKPSTRNGNRSVLFLSRIHRGKGLINLIHAWAVISPVGWRLKIAGPNEDGHLEEVSRAARALGILDSIDYLGEIDGEKKTRTYEVSDLFVLPTFSENFGVVVAEALAHGLPVITTRGAPWAALETYGCGWWIDIGVNPLVLALREAMKMTDTERQAMGARGKEFVKRYNWHDIATKLSDVYRWVLGEGGRPKCVELD